MPRTLEPIKRLTARQQQVLNAIDALTEKTGYCPTFRELANVLKIKSPNGIVSHLKPLKALGFCRWEPGKTRTLVTTLKPR